MNGKKILASLFLLACTLFSTSAQPKYDFAKLQRGSKTSKGLKGLQKNIFSDVSDINGMMPGASGYSIHKPQFLSLHQTS